MDGWMDKREGNETKRTARVFKNRIRRAIFWQANSLSGDFPATVEATKMPWAKTEIASKEP